MKFKRYIIILPVIFYFQLIYCDINNNYISTEVVNRKGGLSNYKKSILYTDGKLGLIYGITSSQASSLKSLEQYAVCEAQINDSHSIYQYFICPNSDDRTRNFCCGKRGQQKCCTENDFRSSIKFVRNFLFASISTILGVFIGSFNLLLIGLIILYWYYLVNKSNKPKNQYEIPMSSIPLNYTTPVTRSDLTDNTISKSSLHIRKKNAPSIISKPGTNTPTNSVIVVPRPMKKR